MHITRRYFLQSSGALALYCGLSPLRTLADVGLTPADIKPVTRGKTFVAVFLRGGMDGLNFITPFGDPGYKGLRLLSIGLASPGAPGGVSISTAFSASIPARRHSRLFSRTAPRWRFMRSATISTRVPTLRSRTRGKPASRATRSIPMVG